MMMPFFLLQSASIANPFSETYNSAIRLATYAKFLVCRQSLFFLPAKLVIKTHVVPTGNIWTLQYISNFSFHSAATKIINGKNIYLL